MKLVDLLARELESWPEGYVAIVQAGDKDCMPIDSLEVYWDGSQWDYTDTSMRIYDDMFRVELLASDHSTAIITREMWQSARDKLKGESAMITPHKPKANKDGWIRHRGGKCPVAKGTCVDVRYRNGSVVLKHWLTEQQLTGDAGLAVVWQHKNDDLDIMAYRIHAPEQAEKSIEQRIIEAEQSAIAAQANNECGDAKDNNDPRVMRDRIREIDSTVEALEEERESLIQRLADEGLKLLRVDGKSMPKQPELDMGDWRNWRVGDLVEVLDPERSGLMKGAIVKIIEVDLGVDEDEDEAAFMPCKLKGANTWLYFKNMKWHSRPSK